MSFISSRNYFGQESLLKKLVYFFLREFKEGLFNPFLPLENQR
jgi:hypothetical protein